MHAAGNKPPISVPARGMHLIVDVLRASDYYKVPVTFPPVFPTNSLNSMRVLTVINQYHPKEIVPCTRAIYQAYFSKSKEVIEEAIGTCNFTSDQVKTIMELSGSNEIKQKLKEVTEDAVNRGAFGAPTMYFKKDENSREEMFFGSDRFALIAHVLGLKYEGPCAGSKL